MNSEPGYISKWNHYNNLLFLQEHIGGLGISTDNLQEDTSNTLSSPKDQIIGPKMEFCYETFTQPEEMTIKYGKRKYEEVSTDVLDTSDFLTPASRTESYFEDEDMCFFKSLVNHVKLLNPQKKMLLRMKIQELVYNEVYGNK